jgi:hypothetical protein
MMQRHDTKLRVMLVPATRGLTEVRTRDSREATKIGRYWNDLRPFLETGDDSELLKYRDQFIVDADGKRVPLLTDLDELERLGSVGALSFESIYARAR